MGREYALDLESLELVEKLRPEVVRDLDAAANDASSNKQEPSLIESEELKFVGTDV